MTNEKESEQIALRLMGIKECCSNCRYWLSEHWKHRKTKGARTKGACRRYPPTFVSDFSASFPKTRNGDWCGEFTPVIRVSENSEND